MKARGRFVSSINKDKKLAAYLKDGQRTQGRLQEATCEKQRGAEIRGEIESGLKAQRYWEEIGTDGTGCVRKINKMEGGTKLHL